MKKFLEVLKSDKFAVCAAGVVGGAAAGGVFGLAAYGVNQLTDRYYIQEDGIKQKWVNPILMGVATCVGVGVGAKRSIFIAKQLRMKKM